MTAVYTPGNVFALDNYASGVLLIPPILLMENAARSMSEHLRIILANNRHHVVFLCGSGNNGGDGYALARHLCDEHDISIVAVAEPASESCCTNAASAERMYKVISWENRAAASALLSNATVVVDAIYGVGGRLPIPDDIASLVDFVNMSDSIKIAVDIPTGLDANTGRTVGAVFLAHHTLTMAAIKTGMLRNDGPSVCGSVHVASLGLSYRAVLRHTDHFALTEGDVREWLPPRISRTSKFDYGRVLVVGGSLGMPGAPSLTAHAAIAAGAGLVEMASVAIHELTPREVITTLLPARNSGTIHPEAGDILSRLVSKASVVAVGPGLGDDSDTLAFMARFLSNLPPEIKVVIDADGLRLFKYGYKANDNVILTPHLGELARLMDMQVPDVRQQVLEVAVKAAQQFGCVVHAKDVPSVSTDGTGVFWCKAGNPGMATAGSGDVLTGIIAALMSQHLSPLRAAALGAYVHAHAGDVAVKTKSVETLMATDIIVAMDKMFA